MFNYLKLKENLELRTERNVPWEVKWAETMNKVNDLFDQIEYQQDLVKEQIEIKHQS